jgi:hypothetical protein
MIESTKVEKAAVLVSGLLRVEKTVIRHISTSLYLINLFNTYRDMFTLFLVPAIENPLNLENVPVDFGVLSRVRKA